MSTLARPRDAAERRRTLKPHLGPAVIPAAGFFLEHFRKMVRMKAPVCRKPGELSFEDRPAPGSPGPGWALVSISHVGICGTDYHIFEGKHPYLAYPRVMGHEVSGTIAAINAPGDIAVGEQVLVNPYLACAQCAACRQVKPNCCVATQALGVHRHGAMS